MNWLLAALLCLGLVELLARLPLAGALARLQGASVKALRTVRARSVSDHWKEKAMGAYARTAFLSTLRLALMLLAAGAVLAALVLLFEQAASGFGGFLLSWQGIGFTLVFASGYFAVRRAALSGRL